MTNKYLEKIAAFSVSGIGNKIKETGRILAGRNVAEAETKARRSGEALRNVMGRVDERNKTLNNVRKDKSKTAHDYRHAEAIYNSGLKRASGINRTFKEDAAALRNAKNQTSTYRRNAAIGVGAVGGAAIVGRSLSNGDPKFKV